MDNQLRKAIPGYQKPWTKAEILAGLEYYFQQNGRYPTAVDIDSFEYLPSSRSLQRQFGGLVALRQELIPDSHSDFTKGSYRSERANEAGKRAKIYEGKFYDYLLTKFDAIAVHEQKRLRPGNIACDYFIYIDEKDGIAIDLFYAQDIRSATNVVNIKLKRYSILPYKIFFILVGNNSLTIDILQELVKRRRIPLPENIALDTEDNFKNITVDNIQRISRYSKAHLP